MHQLWWALDEKNIAEIINTRNDVAHGSEPSDLNARTWLGPQGPGFRTFLTKLWQRLRFRIFFVVNSAYDGRVMVNECRALEGESPVLPNCQVQSDDRLVAREVYALPGVKAVDSILRLAPFLMLEPGHELNSWRSFVFDGWRGKASVPSGEEGLRYIEVWSGTRFDDLGKRLKAVPEFVWRS